MRPRCRLPFTIHPRSAHYTIRAPLQRIHTTPYLLQSPGPTSSNDDKNDDYYSLLLSSPLLCSSPSASQPKPSSPLSESLSKDTKDSDNEVGKPPDVRVVFGSRLAGPAQARDRPKWATQRPEEPDNCCMSGCVHCVWDLYREEMEEWAERQRRRENAMGALVGTMRDKGVGEAGTKGQDNEGRVGDLDGMGDGYDGMDVSNEGLFESIPIGIREFMNTEKRLRERKERKAIG